VFVALVAFVAFVAYVGRQTVVFVDLQICRDDCIARGRSGAMPIRLVGARVADEWSEDACVALVLLAPTFL